MRTWSLYPLGGKQGRRQAERSTDRDREIKIEKASEQTPAPSRLAAHKTPVQTPRAAVLAHTAEAEGEVEHVHTQATDVGWS